MHKHGWFCRAGQIIAIAISPALSDWYNQLMYVANRYIRKYNVYQFIIASLKVDMSILLLSMQSEISKIPSVHAFGIIYITVTDVIVYLLIYFC